MSREADLFRLASGLESRRADLLTAGDVGGLTGLLSEHLYYAHSTGLVDSRQAFLEKFKNGEFVFQSVGTRLDAVIALGEAAFQASGLLDLDVRVGGQDRHIQAIYLVVWQQEDGFWRLVGHQATSVPDGTPSETA
ncbi:nuclear transport factor 2 family protein [Streptomyces sp. NPDC057717]|uniref:nuclear transport factor 2 family protein n=1 Tax=Streptomyces sp. NPDC057717 TaxID=3346224 RepID=UPI0036AB7408